MRSDAGIVKRTGVWIRMRVFKSSGFPVLLLFLFTGTGLAAQSWEVATRGMKTNLRGVSVAHNPSEKRAPSAVVWSSGSHGVIVRSLDEGRSWRRLRVSGGDALDFRGNAKTTPGPAYVISSGEGVKSRIYK